MGWSAGLVGATSSLFIDLETVSKPGQECPQKNGKNAKAGQGAKISVIVRRKQRLSVGFNPGLGPFSWDLGLSVGIEGVLEEKTVVHYIYCCCYDKDCEKSVKDPK